MEEPTLQNQNGGTADADRPLSELARQLSEESSRLARLEVELAKAEVAHKGKQIGLGAGAFGIAGVIAFFAIGALTAAAILGLAELVSGWLAALLVGATLGLWAGFLALAGKERIGAGTPPTPEQAIESTKQDIKAAKRGAKEARS